MRADITAGSSTAVLADAGAAAQQLPAAADRRQLLRAPAEWLGWEHGDGLRDGVVAAASSAALTTMILTSLIIVSLAAAPHASWLSPTARTGDYPWWLSGPLAPAMSWITFGTTTLKAVFTAAVATMYVAYIVVVICAPRLRAGYALSALVVLQLIFFISPPLPLTDIFNYLNYGRMEVVYHLNPYTTIPALEPHTDPTFALSNWHGLQSPYGPLLTLLTMAVVPLGIAGSYWALKTALLATSLGSVWLLWRSAELLGRNRVAVALFFGANPLVLVWGLGADHSDFLMVFLIVLACYLLIEARLRRERLDAPAPGEDAAQPRWRRALARLDGAVRPPTPGEPGWWWELGAGVLIAGALAIKASALILVPIVLAASARRLRLAAGLAIGAVGLAIASLLAFGASVPDLSQQDALVMPGSVPNIAGYLIGAGGDTTAVRWSFNAALAITVVACTVWAWRRREWILPSAVATLALLLSLSWQLPWYLMWLLPFAALARGRRTRVAAIVLGGYMFLVGMPFASTFENDIGLHMSSSVVGRSDQRFEHSLLY
jgi:alpha-1,6-mannosyltransferase